MISFHATKYISDDDFETFDQLHYKTENELLRLAESIQNKIKSKDNWNQSYGKQK